MIDVSKLSGESIKFGATVTLVDEDTDQKKVWQIVGEPEADLKTFEDFVRRQPLVRECWMLSGEIDFILKCVAPDLKTFQAFVAELTAAPHVRNVKTSLTLRNSKDAAMVPFELKAAPPEGGEG